MTQQEKKEHWDVLKAAGWKPEKHYREYTTEDLRAGADTVRAAQKQARAEEINVAPQPPISGDQLGWDARRDELNASMKAFAAGETPSVPQPEVIVKDSQAGLRANTHDEYEPIRVEPSGREVYQDEVRKPSFAKPRGRRVIKYNDPGVRQVTTTQGDFTETFEMPGEGIGRPAEAKITLPSFQVGIYRDPGSPFRIHEYNGVRGFDLFEVENYFGSADSVPEGVKRIYVSNSLCYDIRSVIRAIENEARRLGVLKGI